MNFYQNVLCKVTEISFQQSYFRKHYQTEACQGLINLPVLSKIERLEQFFSFMETMFNLRCEFGTAWQRCMFLIRTIEEALFLNILVLHYFSFSKPCWFFLSKINLLSSWQKKRKDYCYKDGGKGIILLSLKSICHYSNVFSVTETYLECFSFPLINCNSWNTAALKKVSQSDCLI